MDIVKLGIEVDSRKVKTATKDLDRLEKEARQTEKSTNSLASTFGKFAGILTAVGGSFATLKLVSVTREFDKLNAGLITATGSAENAGVAFEALQDFAASTPYDIQQVTDSFTKLVNYGLTPSERALESYGNTASSLGKSLNQMVEAVADAATGEFERLKEFGIKASKEGDKIAFTFRGVRTEIRNNARDIENYLIQLGENNFASAMAARMDTLDGALSNLGDSWDMLFLTISQQGIGDLIENAVRIAIDALEELTAMVSSGELIGYIDAFAMKWRDWADDIAITLDLVGNMFSVHMKSIAGEGFDTVNFLIDAFRNFPENVRAFIQLMVVEFAHTFDKIGILADDFAAKVKAIFTSDTMDEVSKRTEQRLNAINQARESSIIAIMEERNNAVKSFNTQIDRAGELRKAYDEAAAARKKLGGDRLAGFGIAPQETTKTSGGDASNVIPIDRASEALKRQGEIITQSVMTPIEQYNAAISDLDTLLLEDAITHETWERAANKAWTDTVGKVKQSTDDISEFTKAAAESMQRAMSDFFFDFMQGNLDDLGDSFKRTIDRMVADALAAELGNALFGNTAKGGSGSGGLLSGAMDFVGSLLSFDGGGSTGTGPRTGGVDGKGGFPAVLHPNETVIDHTKGQSAGGVVVSINVNGVRDEGGLKRTAAQIAQQSGIAAQRAMSRNG